MKKLILFSFLAIISIAANSQELETYLNNEPNRILLDGNNLYITANDKLMKVDISISNPAPEILVSGLSDPMGLAIKGTTCMWPNLEHPKS